MYQPRMQLTLPRLVLRELARNLVKLGPIAQLLQGLFLLRVFLALDLH